MSMIPTTPTKRGRDAEQVLATATTTTFQLQLAYSSLATLSSEHTVKRARLDGEASSNDPNVDASTTSTSTTISQPKARPAIPSGKHYLPPIPPASIASLLTPTFWHDDGDLVIVLRDSVEFRVHAMRLVAASRTFAALLSNCDIKPPVPLTTAAARPPYAYTSQKDRDLAKEESRRAATIIAEHFRVSTTSGGESSPQVISDCPVIRLYEDNARDWLVALEASHDFLSFLHRPVLFDTLSSALRIATKYDMQFLREWAVTQMRVMWPSHLDQMTPTALPRAADAIALARQYNIPGILPAAFYALSIQRWRTGSVAQRAHAALTVEDLEALFAGREALQDTLLDIIASPLTVGQTMRTIYSEDSNTVISAVFPPSPAPSPKPQSSVPDLQISPAPESAPKPSPDHPPTLTFCLSSEAPCRGTLCVLWRRALSPDSDRPWGTWLTRELHRLATLPRDALGASVIMNELRTLGESEGNRVDLWPNVTAEADRASIGGNRSTNSSPKSTPTVLNAGNVDSLPTLSETERRRRAEARAPVCAHCWEENRRLARWRLEWLCDAIPRMFRLVRKNVVDGNAKMRFTYGQNGKGVSTVVLPLGV